MQNIKKYVCEFFGTMGLVIFGCGVAVATGCYGNDGIVATSLAFGFAILIMVYAIGGVSGCHINPAVSLAMLITKRISPLDCAYYVASQILGAVAGASIIALFFGSFSWLGSNTAQAVLVHQYGNVGSLFIALASEIFLTFVFVFVVLAVTSKNEFNKISGIVIGLALALVHLLGIRLTGTSVNPARSIGPAILEMFSGNLDAISQIWIFIVGPIIGAVIAAFAFCMLNDKCEH